MFPGGKVDLGEMLLQAAHRELEERNSAPTGLTSETKWKPP